MAWPAAWRGVRAAAGGGFVAGPDFRAGAHSPFNTLFVTPFTRPPLHAAYVLQGAAEDSGQAQVEQGARGGGAWGATKGSGSSNIVASGQKLWTDLVWFGWRPGQQIMYELAILFISFPSRLPPPHCLSGLPAE